MSGPLHDDRLRFFLEHRDDILEWAAIEQDVMRAVRELLAGAQSEIEARLLELDPEAVAVRRDNGQWERIMLRREPWPDWFGVTLEWETRVDPFGRNLPKVGVFFVADTPDRQAMRVEVFRALASMGLEALGYKVTATMWPALKRVPASKTWWQDPDSWLAGIINELLNLWQHAAPGLNAAVGLPSATASLESRA